MGTVLLQSVCVVSAGKWRIRIVKVTYSLTLVLSALERVIRETIN